MPKKDKRPTRIYPDSKPLQSPNDQSLPEDDEKEAPPIA